MLYMGKQRQQINCLQSIATFLRICIRSIRTDLFKKCLDRGNYFRAKLQRAEAEGMV